MKVYFSTKPKLVLPQKKLGLEKRVSRNTVLNLLVGSVGIDNIMSCERYSSMDKFLRIRSYVLQLVFYLRTKKGNEK